MIGKKWTVGLAVLLAACSAEHTSMPTAATSAIERGVTQNRPAPNCPCIIPVEDRIVKLFKPRDVLVATLLYAKELSDYKRGNVSAAQADAAQLYAYMVQLYNAGKLNGAGTTAGALAVSQLGNDIFCNAGITVNLSPSLNDNVVAIVPPNTDTIVRTGTANAGVQLFAAQQLPQSVVIITRLPDTAHTAACAQYRGPLCTPLAQFPPFYDYQVQPAPSLGQGAPLFNVEECIDLTQIHVPFSQLAMAHNVTTGGATNAQILPPASGTLGLSCDGGTSMMRTHSGILNRFASAISHFFVNTAYALTGTGITGKTKSFSPFGTVDTADFVPYLNGGWTYHAPTFTAPPAPGTGDIQGFEQPSFVPDNTWVSNTSPFGNAPFGSVDAGYGCALNTQTFLNTVWPSFTQPPTTGNLNTDASTIFLLRNTFFVPSNWTQNLQVGIAVDNDVEVFMNGTAVTPVGEFVTHEGCAQQDAPGFVFTVPTSMLVVGGENVLAIRARDRGGNSYIDASLSPAP